MAKEKTIVEVRKTQYKCPICRNVYSSREEAEACTTKPKEPKYGVGEWVVTNKDLSIANPAFDDWYGGEEPYDNILKGTPARISSIRNRKPKKTHPSYEYNFGEGIFPLTYHAVREEDLDRLDATALDSLKSQHKEICEESKKKAGRLEDIIKMVEKGK